MKVHRNVYTLMYTHCIPKYRPAERRRETSSNAWDTEKREKGLATIADTHTYGIDLHNE